MDIRLLSLAEVAVTTESGEPIYSPYGYIIDGDARIHALTHRWFHGVVTAILYPEVTKAAGYLPPAGEIEDVDVFGYQRFEHENASNLPLLRVAVSTLTNATMVSKGCIPPTDGQLEALRLCFKALGLKGNDTLTGDESDIKVSEYLEALRQERNSNNSDEET